MKFQLSFEGPLPSSGNANDAYPRPAKLQAIWKIRDSINSQLLHLVETHPALSGRSSPSRALRHALIPPIVVDGFPFRALARAHFKVKCSLKIDLLVNHEPGSVITKRGDLDNRIKTLMDGLRVPASQQEIKNFASKDFLKQNDYVCLLEDDILVSALDVEMQRYLGPPMGAGEDHVRANIGVKIEPTEHTFNNEAFQND
jgi:hypothetical protein